MNRAFVTGATGFVGLNLIEVLVEAGWRVTALHRATSDLRDLGRFPVERVAGDVTDRDSLRRTMPEAPDAVFHAAGNLSFWSRHDSEQERVNIGGTRNMVAEALEKGAARFVHTSSIVAYGLHRRPISEETPRARAGYRINYIRTKALAEDEVRRGIDQGLDAVLLNPAMVVGRYDRWAWSRLIARVHRGRLPGVPPGGGSFCGAREVARAHLAAVAAGRCGENYLLGGTEATVVELARVAGELAGRATPRRPLPAWLVRLAARLAVWSYRLTRRPPEITPEATALLLAQPICRSDKAARELGYRAVPLREMVEDCYRWMLEEGLLATH